MISINHSVICKNHSVVCRNNTVICTNSTVVYSFFLEKTICFTPVLKFSIALFLFPPELRHFTVLMENISTNTPFDLQYRNIHYLTIFPSLYLHFHSKACCRFLQVKDTIATCLELFQCLTCCNRKLCDEFTFIRNSSYP